MNKILIFELLDKIDDARTNKINSIKLFEYENGAKFRDIEKKYLNELDMITGITDFYTKFYLLEKDLERIDRLILSIEELLKVGNTVGFTDSFMNYNRHSEYLTILHRERSILHTKIVEKQKKEKK